MGEVTSQIFQKNTGKYTSIKIGQYGQLVWVNRIFRAKKKDHR